MAHSASISRPQVGGILGRGAAAVLGVLLSIASTGALPTRAFAAPGTPMLPGEQTCRYELPSHMVWWAQEIWAWERICLGEIANLSQFNSGAGTNCDPRKADQWPDSRNLRSLFFETLLDHEPYRTVLRRNGLRVACANVAEALNLSHLAIEHALWIQSTRFRGLVNLVDFKSSSLINLYDMVADRQVVADRLRVAGDLRLNKSELKNFRLTEAMIGGDLDASGATFANTLFAQRLTVGGNLYLRNNARFLESGKLGSVVLRGAKISGHLWASGSVFEGLFNADRLQIGGNLYLHEGTTFQDIHLRDARVDGHVSASGSFFNGSFRGVDPSRKSGGALHRLHCFCLEFDGACEVQRRVPTDWIIEPIDVSGYGSFSLAS